MTIIAAYSGTFDPVTLGHNDIIHRAARMFPKLIVAVGSNIAKNPRFTLEERCALIRAAASDLKNVEVIGSDFDRGVLNDAKRLGAVDATEPNPIKAVSNASMVVIATPILAFPEVLDVIAPHLPEGCVVTDVGSTNPTRPPSTRTRRLANERRSEEHTSEFQSH